MHRVASPPRFPAFARVLVMTPPLSLALALSAPALFPSLHPIAVWLGLGCIALAAWALMRADEWGGSETTIRAMEAKDLLARMSDRRIA